MNSSQFLSLLGRLSLQAGVLVLVVLLVQWIFRRRLSPQWRCALWLLVVVRLLLPVSLTSSASIFNLLPRAAVKPSPQLVSYNDLENEPEVGQGDAARQPAVDKPLAVVAVSSDPRPLISKNTVAPASGMSAPHNFAGPISWGVIALATWLVGAAILLAHVLVSSFRLARRVADLPPVTEPGVLAVLEDCRRQLGVATRLRVVECADMSSPALQGLFRPQLLLPKNVAAEFSSRELRYIFLHELAHVKRRDLWLNWLMVLLQALHWFNPLVWIGFARWRADRELACDALAIETAGAAQNGEYGRTMLRLLENFMPRAAVPGMVGIFEDKQQLRERIEMIARFRPASRWSRLAMVLVAVIAVICLTDAKTTDAVGAAERPAFTYVPPNDQDPVPLDLSQFFMERFVHDGKVDASVAGIGGRQMIDGLPFQVDGRVLLYGRNYTQTYKTTSLEWVTINVGRKFEELHLLHGTFFADVEGKQIAFIRLNYADRTEAILPILYGGHVRDYQRLRTEEKELLTDPNSKVIWRGPGITSFLGTQRLFKSMFVNPHPEKLVTCIDVTSTRHLASYFLTAATVANHDPSRPVTPPSPAGEERHFRGTIGIKVVDDITGRPLKGAVLQPAMDVDGVRVISTPLQTSARGEAEVRYPLGRETNINIVVQKEGYYGKSAQWFMNFPDTTTFRLTPAPAVDRFTDLPPDSNSFAYTPPARSLPLSEGGATQKKFSTRTNVVQVASLIAYEGFDYTGRESDTTNFSSGTGWAAGWSSSGPQDAVNSHKGMTNPSPRYDLVVPLEDLTNLSLRLNHNARLVTNNLPGDAPATNNAGTNTAAGQVTPSPEGGATNIGVAQPATEKQSSTRKTRSGGLIAYEGFAPYYASGGTNSGWGTGWSSSSGPGHSVKLHLKQADGFGPDDDIRLWVLSLLREPGAAPASSETNCTEKTIYLEAGRKGVFEAYNVPAGNYRLRGELWKNGNRAAQLDIMAVEIPAVVTNAPRTAINLGEVTVRNLKQPGQASHNEIKTYVDRIPLP